jgi:hypothetical protein
VQERDGAQLVLSGVKDRFARLERGVGGWEHTRIAKRLVNPVLLHLSAICNRPHFHGLSWVGVSAKTDPAGEVVAFIGFSHNIVHIHNDSKLAVRIKAPGRNGKL